MFRRLTASVLMLLVVIVTMTAAPVRAAETGTEDEAKALVERALAFYREKGREAAFAAFSDPKGAFVDRDLYVLAGDLNGVFLAHGTNRGLIGKNLSELKDVNGKFIVRSMVEVARTSPQGGWVDYVWTNPTTKKLEPKKTWIRAVDDFFVGVGVYDRNAH